MRERRGWLRVERGGGREGGEGEERVVESREKRREVRERRGWLRVERGGGREGGEGEERVVESREKGR